MPERMQIAVAIAAFTLFGFFLFPGHTYLQSDTQIYAPMLERRLDPGLLQNDFMVERPHMAFTIYDELAVGLRKVTGLGYREILAGLQLAFRTLGILGVFLIVSSFGLGTRMSLVATAMFSLGATIWGPTVLTFEYEPIPRAFALALIFLAIGLEARGWPLAAGAAAAAALLLHGTTTIPYWICYVLLVLWPAEPSVRRHRLLGLAPLGAVVAVLAGLSLAQPDRTQPLMHFTALAPWWEQVLRLRAPYVWLSLWETRWYWHYAILAAVCAAGIWRLRKWENADLRFFLVGLPALGILSLPFSLVLLEAAKSSLAPQLQPMRTLLFVTAVASLVSLVAGIRAAQHSRWGEAMAWLAAAAAIPTGNAIQALLLPDLGDFLVWRRLFLVIYVAGGIAVAAWCDAHGHRRRTQAWLAMLVLPFVLYPIAGGVVNYTVLHTAELDGLCRWARTSTPKEAVFLFPDAKRDLYPGVFRAEALRAVYVDWKSGGQANYQQDVAAEWWKRWQAIRPDRYKPRDPRAWAGFGIDYVVLRAENRRDAPPPVFENASYAVYRVR